VKLMELAGILPGVSIAREAQDVEVAGVQNDSRRIRPGDLFVAIRGAKFDGFAHVEDAVARGAVAVVSDRPTKPGVAVAWIRVEAPRRALGELSARLRGNPAEKLVLAGVTGTNGKTSTATLIEAILSRRFGRAGLLATTLYRTPRREIPAGRTTPEAPLIQEILAELVAEGVPAASLEVSSHALVLDRVAGCRFDVAVFTDLTRDHLDFHGDMESYYAAKKLLFDMRKPGARGVVNVDDAYGRRLLSEASAPMEGFSPSGNEAAYRAEAVHCDLSGTSFDVVHSGGRFRLASPLLGRFQVGNLLGAAAAGLCLGIAPDEIASAVAGVRDVPGRLERVEAGQPYTILVDYAHTPDALERLLLSVRELTDRKVILVFGCGGDRDAGKRAPMGEIAGRLSDIPIATSDNPRSENPEAILRAVEKGLQASGNTKHLKVVDRGEAIRQAIELANPGTVVVIAGKGHETTQVIGDKEIPFDDRRVAAGFAGRS
jgi:UDP-N-acetylmuramoyl-L-alanyl-D-glutamate--2,6-diaminopimelate ligase